MGDVDADRALKLPCVLKGLTGLQKQFDFGLSRLALQKSELIKKESLFSEETTTEMSCVCILLLD